MLTLSISSNHGGEDHYICNANVINLYNQELIMSIYMCIITVMIWICHVHVFAVHYMIKLA